jgi:bifunctional non-homologous end joining protein LigD
MVPPQATDSREAGSGVVAFPEPLIIDRDGDGWRVADIKRRLRISNPDKPFFPDDGYTKGDLLQYYTSIAPALLPHLAGRALSLARYPDGAAGDYFYEKQCPSHAPGWIVRAPLHSSHRDEPIEFCTAPDLASLVWVANLGCIEMHPWLSRVERPDYPDFAVFDLDPQEGVGWDQVVYVAGLVNVLLERLGLASYPKTSGATGIHIYVPLDPIHGYRRVRRFVETLGRLLASADPDAVTMEWDIPKRGARVFVDHNQNVGGKTIASVYSVRPVPGAQVSMPFTWPELDAVEPSGFTIGSIWERLRQYGDLFAPVLTGGQTLDGAEQALGLPGNEDAKS